MDGFCQSELGALFYLAGGTALALQLGHRKSIDLDFFSPSEDIPSIRIPLMKSLESFDPLLADSSWGNLVFLARGVRLGFYGYGYSMVGVWVPAGAARLASIEDIGLMKLETLLSRASRKDFHDLYAICQRIPLRQLLDYAPQKYAYVRDFEAQVVRRLAYFERAEQEEPVPLLQPVAWDTVKQYFRHQAKILGKGWIL
jgi:Nucleotidyl transferase AbiEii toxin, Type IV TA system